MNDFIKSLNILHYDNIQQVEVKVTITGSVKGNGDEMKKTVSHKLILDPKALTIVYEQEKDNNGFLIEGNIIRASMEQHEIIIPDDLVIKITDKELESIIIIHVYWKHFKLKELTFDKNQLLGKSFKISINEIKDEIYRDVVKIINDERITVDIICSAIIYKLSEFYKFIRNWETHYIGDKE